MSKMDVRQEMNELRKKIAEKTICIIRLCGERFELAKKLSILKLKENTPIENPEIEESLKKQSLQKCRNSGIDEDFCLNLVNLLIDESKRLQEMEIKSLEKGRRSKE